MTNTNPPPQVIDSGCNPIPSIAYRPQFALKVQNLKTSVNDLSVAPNTCDRLEKTPDGLDEEYQVRLLTTPGGPDGDRLR